MTTTRIQFGADGNPDEAVASDPNVPSGKLGQKDDDPLKQGVSINPHQQVGHGVVQCGAGAAVEQMNKDAQVRVDAFIEDLDRLQSVTSAGRTLDDKTVENLQNELNDTAIAYVRMGGDVNSPALVALREKVDQISRQALANRR